VALELPVRVGRKPEFTVQATQKEVHLIVLGPQARHRLPFPPGVPRPRGFPIGFSEFPARLRRIGKRIRRALQGPDGRLWRVAREQNLAKPQVGQAVPGISREFASQFGLSGIQVAFAPQQIADAVVQARALRFTRKGLAIGMQGLQTSSASFQILSGHLQHGDMFRMRAIQSRQPAFAQLAEYLARSKPHLGIRLSG
jgi:hypothetical protein